MARIELQEMAHSYKSKPQGPEDYALKRLEHVWEDGMAYALLGPSGCGKSTMLNIISGLLTPSEGRVLFDGKDVTRLRPEQRNIAQVFQFPVIYDTMTVYDNLAFPLRNRRVAESEVHQRVTEVAQMLEVTDILKRRGVGLSADQKQKISMGRGLVRADVAAILFDEPLTVIDPHLKFLIRRKLKQVHERYNHTMVYVTHDQVEALTFADKVVVFYDGVVVQMGQPHELFETPEHTFVGYFIGSPGMNVIPCHLEGGYAVAGEMRVPLDNGVIANAQKQQASKLEMGIRPEFIQLHTQSSPDSVAARVLEVNDLGNYEIVTVQMGEQRLFVKLPEDETVSSDEVHLRFPAQWTRLYADDWLVRAQGE